MPTSQRLPDAMPDVEKPTLLVVCDTHHCMFIDVGNHALMVAATVESKEHKSTERPSLAYSPSGMIGGLDESTKVERNRLREFAGDVCKHIDQMLAKQGALEVYVSAPGKFLAVLKERLSTAAAKQVRAMVDGNFVKEPPKDILLRFRPDLEKGMQNLRDQEGYSPKKHLPKK